MHTVAFSFALLFLCMFLLVSASHTDFPTFFHIFFDSSCRCFWRSCRMTVCLALITRSSIGRQRSFALSPSLRCRHKQPKREACMFPYILNAWKCTNSDLHVMAYRPRVFFFEGKTHLLKVHYVPDTLRRCTLSSLLTVRRVNWAF